MKYENGFYIYTPSKEGGIWLTGVGGDFDIDYVKAVGAIGKMVMTQEGEIR